MGPAEPKYIPQRQTQTNTLNFAPQSTGAVSMHHYSAERQTNTGYRVLAGAACVLTCAAITKLLFHKCHSKFPTYISALPVAALITAACALIVCAAVYFGRSERCADARESLKNKLTQCCSKSNDEAEPAPTAIDIDGEDPRLVRTGGTLRAQQPSSRTT